MLQYEMAKNLYEEIREKASTCTVDEFDEFYQEFLQSAAEYAQARLTWTFMDQAARKEDDASRTIKHDGFMAMLSAICRNLDIKGIDELMSTRKEKGDFACYIAAFLALEQR